jgi:hypothetical protein
MSATLVVGYWRCDRRLRCGGVATSWPLTYMTARRGEKERTDEKLIASVARPDSCRRAATTLHPDECRASWSVAIYTQRGDCSSVRVAAQIVGGRVYSKDQSYQANGAVGANGVIRVSVASGRLSASGSGRLSANSGAGRWASSRGECSGSWSASRRAG